MLGSERSGVRADLEDLDDLSWVKGREGGGMMKNVEYRVRFESLKHIPSTGGGGRSQWGTGRKKRPVRRIEREERASNELSYQ